MAAGPLPGDPPQQPPQAPQMPQDGGSGAGKPPAPQGAPAPPPGPPQPASQPMPQRPNVITIDQVMKLMRDDRMRSFRIDIETDSTVQADENEYKQRLGEFVTAVATFVDKVLPAAQQHPEMLPFLGETMLTVVRGFRVGRQLEGTIEDAVATLEEAAEKGGAKPMDPNTAKAQAEAAATQAEVQGKLRLMQMQGELAERRHAGEMEKMARNAEADKLEHQARITELMLKHRTSQAEFQRDQALGEQAFLWRGC